MTYLRDENPEILRAANALSVLVERAFRRAEEYPDLATHDFAALRYIAQHEPEGATTPAITRAFNLTTSAGISMVQRLVDRDFITNEAPEGRQRGRRARLTAEGWKALESDPLQKAFAELFPRLSESEIRSIFEAIILADYTQDRWRDMKLGLGFWR